MRNISRHYTIANPDTWLQSKWIHGQLGYLSLKALSFVLCPNCLSYLSPLFASLFPHSLFFLPVLPDDISSTMAARRFLKNLRFWIRPNPGWKKEDVSVAGGGGRGRAGGWNGLVHPSAGVHIVLKSPEKTTAKNHYTDATKPKFCFTTPLLKGQRAFPLFISPMFWYLIFILFHIAYFWIKKANSSYLNFNCFYL